MLKSPSMAPHRNTPAASGVAVSGEPEGSLVNNGGAVFPLSSKFAPFVRVERCAPPAPLGGASGSVSSAAASAPAYSVAIHLQRRNLHDSDLQQFVGWFAACQQQLRQQSAPASLPPSAAAASPPPSAKAAAPPRAPPPRPVLFCSLDLSDNAITANGVWQLLRFFLVRCATVRLTKLKLYKNAIGNGGAVAVSMFIRSAAAKRCLALEELHLSHCCIGNTGCLYILEAVAAACPGASGVQTAHSAGVSGGEGSDSARQSGSSGSPCYPRFDGRRKLYIPLWIRLEYNVIKEPLGEIPAARRRGVGLLRLRERTPSCCCLGGCETRFCLGVSAFRAGSRLELFDAPSPERRRRPPGVFRGSPIPTATTLHSRAVLARLRERRPAGE